MGKILNSYSDLDLDATMTSIKLVLVIFIYYSVFKFQVPGSISFSVIVQTHTHKHTHTYIHTQRDFDKYSIVAFCKNATVTTYLQLFQSTCRFARNRRILSPSFKRVYFSQNYSPVTIFINIVCSHQKNNNIFYISFQACANIVLVKRETFPGCLDRDCTMRNIELVYALFKQHIQSC